MSDDEQSTPGSQPHDAAGAAASDDITTLLILGASGDLTSRLLLPGLGSLLAVETDSRVRVVGADRADMSQEEWADTVRLAFASVQAPSEVVEAVCAETTYVQADLLEPDQLDALLTSVGDPVVL